MDMPVFAQLIEAAIPDAKAHVSGDGSKFEAVVISEAFQGKTLVAKHKMVYAALDEQLKSGMIHALTVKAFTPQEWSTRKPG